MVMQGGQDLVMHAHQHGIAVRTTTNLDSVLSGHIPEVVVARVSFRNRACSCYNVAPCGVLIVHTVLQAT
jgi:hypothetical protein